MADKADHLGAILTVLLTHGDSETEGKIATLEANLNKWSEALGHDVLEYFTWPLPPGAIQENGNVKVREEAYLNQQLSIFPFLAGQFRVKAFDKLKEEIHKSEKGLAWKIHVIDQVNRTLMESDCGLLAPIANEIWIATPMYPHDVVRKWRGPFSLHEDGMSFQYNVTGVYLQPAFTVQFDRHLPGVRERLWLDEFAQSNFVFQPAWLSKAESERLAWWGKRKNLAEN